MIYDNEQRKKGLIDALGGGTATGPANTGIGGVPDVSQVAAPPMAPSAPPVSGPASPVASSPFQSNNQSVRGYLDEAVRFNAGNIKGIKDEAGRKSANEQFLQSLVPEIQKRGGSISDIRGDKARVDGRMIDFYRDIEGAADPQFLDVTDEGGAPMGGPNLSGIAGAQNNLNGLLQGDPMAKIQEALAALTNNNQPHLAGLIESLRGGR